MIIIVFSDFSEAVFDIFNVPSIYITDSTFTNNTGTGISRVPFRANTGAVSLGFNNIERNLTLQPLISVSRCNFTGNNASAANAFTTTTSAFFNRIFTGRGGGLGISINESRYNITAMISDNRFVGNYARSFGAGIFMVIFSEGTQNLMLVRRNVFVDNFALLGAGGLVMTFFSIGLDTAPHTLNISDCLFRGNSGESGGAVLFYLSYEGQYSLIVCCC